MKFYKYLVEKSKFPNENEFEDEFRMALNLYRLTGLYRMDSSKKSYAINFIGFMLVVLNYQTGCLRDFIVLFLDGKYFDGLLSGVLMVMTTVGALQILMFMKRQTITVELIKNLQKLHDPADKIELQVHTNRIFRILKGYFKYLVLSAVALIILRSFGFSCSKLLYPMIFNTFAEGNLYVPLLILNYIHIFPLYSAFLACEFLHILCMVRIEANLRVLGTKLKTCTDIDVLNSCVKYHCEIIE